jgi:hypothetical protein
MHPRDLSALNYFLDVVRLDPKRVQDLAKIARATASSPDLQRAIDTVVETVNAAATSGDANQVRQQVVQQVNHLATNSVNAIDEVRRIALGALRGAFSR